MSSRRAVVGVLPDEGKGDDRQSTAELDLALLTGMGKARNVINVLSADVVVICGGGGRPLILLAVPPYGASSSARSARGYRARAIPALRRGQWIYCR